MRNKHKKHGYSLMFYLVSSNLEMMSVERLHYELTQFTRSELNYTFSGGNDIMLNIFIHLNYMIKHKGIEFTNWFLQNERIKKLKRHNLVYKKEVYDLIEKTVCTNFEITPEVLKFSTNRDGVRISALGALVKLLNETLGFDLKQIIKSTEKSRVMISRNRKKFTELEPVHPHNKKMINAYLASKVEILKLIEKND